MIFDPSYKMQGAYLAQERRQIWLVKSLSTVHQDISQVRYDRFARMNYQNTVKHIMSLFVLVVGIIILTNPLLGYSQLLPGGIFELIFGGLLLASGLLLYQIGTNTE